MKALMGSMKQRLHLNPACSTKVITGLQATTLPLLHAFNLNRIHHQFAMLTAMYHTSVVP